MQLPHVTGSKIAQMKLFANVTVRLITKCFPNQNMSRPLDIVVYICHNGGCNLKMMNYHGIYISYCIEKV